MARDCNRAIDAFLRSDAAKESKIALLGRYRTEQVLGQTVMNGAYPPGLRERPALRESEIEITGTVGNVVKTG